MTGAGWGERLLHSAAIRRCSVRLTEMREFSVWRMRSWLPRGEEASVSGQSFGITNESQEAVNGCM